MGRSVWLVRHGHRLDFACPEWFETAPRRYDPPLSEQGFKESQKLAQRLTDEKIDHLFCSPFLRAIQTAAAIADALTLPIKIEQGLGEWLNPEWMTEYPQTEPLENLCANYPKIDRRDRSLVLPIYPETEAEMMERMAKTITLLLANYEGNFLLIGHSATVGGVAAALLAENVILKAPVASLSQLVYQQNQWKLNLKTDISFIL